MENKLKTKAAINDYVKVLQKQKELKDTYLVETAKWETTKKKIEAFLLGLLEPIFELPEEIREQSPFLAWKISGKTDESLIAAHMEIDDLLIPALQKEIDDKINTLKEQKAELESYALALMTERKCSNFGVTGIGRVENRTSTKYNVADKKLFVTTALLGGYADEITVSIRPNSKLMANIVEETGELPPGVSCFSEHKAVFVRK